MSDLTAENLRNADFQATAELLMSQNTRKLDVVAGAVNVRFERGRLIVAGTAAEITEDGVTSTEGAYVPTPAFIQTQADKLSVPAPFLRRLHTDRPDLYDHLANGLLHGDGEDVEPDERRFLFRLFTDPDGGGEGVARAMLGQRYKAIDHVDATTSVLSGVREADPEAQVLRCDVTDRRLYLSVATPAIAAHAPVLLGDYSPTVPGLDQWRIAANREGRGFAPGSEPIVHAGIEVRNSELGFGSFSIMPRLVVKVCGNGLTLPLLAKRVIHAGAALDEGTVDWSADVRRKQLELIQATARETVAHFLSPAFVQAQIAEVEAKAGRPVASDVVEVIGNVGRQLGLTQAETDSVLDHFIGGRQRTAGGIVNAITAYSQGVESAERAHELDDLALRALDLVPVA